MRISAVNLGRVGQGIKKGARKVATEVNDVANKVSEKVPQKVRQYALPVLIGLSTFTAGVMVPNKAQAQHSFLMEKSFEMGQPAKSMIEIDNFLIQRFSNNWNKGGIYKYQPLDREGNWTPSRLMKEYVKDGKFYDLSFRDSINTPSEMGYPIVIYSKDGTLKSAYEEVAKATIKKSVELMNEIKAKNNKPLSTDFTKMKYYDFIALKTYSYPENINTNSPYPSSGNIKEWVDNDEAFQEFLALNSVSGSADLSIDYKELAAFLLCRDIAVILVDNNHEKFETNTPEGIKKIKDFSNKNKIYFVVDGNISFNSLNEFALLPEKNNNFKIFTLQEAYDALYRPIENPSQARNEMKIIKEHVNNNTICKDKCEALRTYTSPSSNYDDEFWYYEY